MRAGALGAAAVGNEGRTGGGERGVVISRGPGVPPSPAASAEPVPGAGLNPEHRHPAPGGHSPASSGCSSLLRRLSTESPALGGPARPPALPKDVVKPLPALTTSRWCFHTQELLQILPQTKASLYNLWDAAGAHTPRKAKPHPEEPG